MAGKTIRKNPKKDPPGGLTVKFNQVPGPYRVGATGAGFELSQLVLGDFGIDARDLGNLSADKLRSLNLSAKAIKQQVAWSKEALKAAKKIMDAKAEIESHSVELIKAGIATRTQIDKLIASMTVEAAKYFDGAQTLSQKSQGDVSKIQAKGRITRQTHSLELADSLRLMFVEAEAKQLADAQKRQTASQGKLADAAQSRIEALEEAQNAKLLRSYISGDDVSVNPINRVRNWMKRKKTTHSNPIWT